MDYRQGRWHWQVFFTLAQIELQAVCYNLLVHEGVRSYDWIINPDDKQCFFSQRHFLGLRGKHKRKMSELWTSMCNILVVGSSLSQPGFSLFRECSILNKLYPSSPRSRTAGDIRCDFQSQFIELRCGHGNSPGIWSQQWALSHYNAVRRHPFNLTISRACPGLFLWKVTVPLFVCHHELKSLNPPEVFIFFFVGCGVRSAISSSLRNVKTEN